ncbi:hypothetical protein BUE80_DR003057 [Diplocarpon rosae]|nr:hypothetical protein BUE80_DR003057 [Diplocarpon rosae]
MSKRTVFTTLTPLPAGISRETVLSTLRAHTEMIDLNPLVVERHPIKPPPNATPEEFHCIWYSLTDRVQYLPGGLASGQVSYTCCFHDLQNGLQTHCYAPLGLDIKGKWTLGGSLPGEPIAPVELGLGAPLHGLWLREDMRCNILMGGFVKKTLKKAHSHLVGRLLVKSQIQEASLQNQALDDRVQSGSLAGSRASTEYSPSSYGPPSIAEASNTHTYSQSALQSPAFFPNQSRNSFGSGKSNNRASSDATLDPAGLNIRNSGSSKKGSSHDPAAGGRHPSSRVSWQSLTPRQSPATVLAEPVTQSSNQYRSSPPQGDVAELPNEQRQDEIQTHGSRIQVAELE